MKRKPVITLTKGLPGSGKSTWARAQQDSYPDRTVLVSKDDLRAMLHQSRYTKANEKYVLDVRDYIVLTAVADGKDVIVHDTNLNPVHESRLRDLVGQRAEFGVNDTFLDVSVAECIARDLERFNSVGSEVILRMHHQYLQKGANVKRVEPPAHVDGAPEAIIVDLDGTLALMGDRSPYDGVNCAVDTVNTSVALLVSDWYCGTRAGRSRHIIFCSGRDGKAREATVQWLFTQTGWDVDDEDVHLFMRAPGDVRKDAIIKEEIYREHILGKFNVAFVLDDRNQVVAKWRELGLTCLQVAPGDF